MNVVQVIAIYAIPVILAITLHEASHGYVALRFGDTTAFAAGRVSLNPIRHIDPVGTVIFPLVLLAIASSLAAVPFSSAGRSRCRSTSPTCAVPSVTCYGSPPRDHSATW